MIVHIYPDSAAVARAAANFLLLSLRGCPGGQRKTIALSGGRTPRAMYQQFRQHPEAGELLTYHATILFSDERAVPPSSAQSNYHLAEVELLRPLRVRPEVVYRLRGEAADLPGEAHRYEGVIRTVTEAEPHGVPSLDVVMLGMGPDGHTASLFPGYDFDKPIESLVEAPYVASQDGYRLTFTLPLINAAKVALFLVIGEEKAWAVKKVLSAHGGEDILPAGRVVAGQTVWMLDEAAAGELDRQACKGSVEAC